MPSLPSFVELLNSLGLSDDNDTNRRHSHIRSNSGDSTSSDTSTAPRYGPSDRRTVTPEVRLSGRPHFPSASSKNHRFSPYLSQDAPPRRGSLSALTIPTLLESQLTRTSQPSRRPRSGSLPTLLESPVLPNNQSPTSSETKRSAHQSRKRLSISIEKARSPPICALLRKSPTSASTSGSGSGSHYESPYPSPRSPIPLSQMTLPTLPAEAMNISKRATPVVIPHSNREGQGGPAIGFGSTYLDRPRPIPTGTNLSVSPRRLTPMVVIHGAA